MPSNTSENREALSDCHAIIYLACPYTDPDPLIREARYKAATVAAANLVRQGRIVYSPITMTHPIDIELAGSDSTLGSDFWVDFDEAFMSMCSEIIILQLEGWERSNGVAREIAFFKAQNKPITYLKPEAKTSEKNSSSNLK